MDLQGPERGAEAGWLLQLPTAHAVDADEDGRLLIRSDSSGTAQLYELDVAGSDGQRDLRPLTDLTEPADGRYIPGRRRVALAFDRGGRELTQLFLLDLDQPPVTDLLTTAALATDARWAHVLAGVSPDGQLVAFVSNRRNGVDFDVWVIDVDTGVPRCLYDLGGWCRPASGFSPDGAWLSVIRPGSRPSDEDLLLIDVESGSVRVIDPHPAAAAIVGPPAWLDAATLVAASSVGRDTQALVRFDLSSGDRDVLLDGPWDHAAWTSKDGSTVLAVLNDDGATSGVFIDAGSGARRGELSLPEPGVMAMAPGHPPPLLSGDGSSVTYTFTSPVRPAGVWHFDRMTGITRGLTAAPPTVGLIAPERHRVQSFDGEELSAAVYRPAGAATTAQPLPAVVWIHGGPEAQSMLTFSPLIQALAHAGLAVVVPNVRGSTGYGKRFASLDDTTRRLDSVADLAAVHDWLGEVGLDPGRAGLWGRSYGGYMVLAACAFQPERWVAGVDEVGMSDLVTFLTNTADYRRAHREREYGSLDTDRDFLISASPLHRAAAIRAALFVIHGANDPRVPLSEARQLVAALRQRDIECEFLVYPDEGHGLSRLSNKLDAYSRAVAFLALALAV